MILECEVSFKSFMLQGQSPWELAEDADSQAPPQNHWLRICIWRFEVSCVLCEGWHLRSLTWKHYSVIWYKLPLLNSVRPLSLQWWLALMMKQQVELPQEGSEVVPLYQGISIPWRTYRCLITEDYNHKLNENMVPFYRDDMEPWLHRFLFAFILNETDTFFLTVKWQAVVKLEVE